MKAALNFLIPAGARRLSLMLGLGAIALMGSACSGPRGNSPADQVVNVYSSRHYNTDTALYNDFTQQTGIKVNLIEGKDAELIERIKSEGKNSPADVLITVDAGRLWRAEQDGLFQPIQSTTLQSEVPTDLRDPQGRWYGFSRRARVIIYNKNKVQPSQLSTYEDLANSRWKGRLCVRSSDNIYNQSMVAAHIEEKGAPATEAWVKGLVANFARPPEGNDTTQIKAVAEGVCDLALVNHYYLARMLSSENPETRAIAEKVGVFFPQSTHVNISGAGVIATAPHQQSAVKFLEYLGSPPGQRYFVAGTHEYPAQGGTDDPTTRSFGPFNAAKVNVDAYGSNNAQAVQIMDRAGWK
jgi:iron(III) transport system substrate-binding protein